MYHRTKIVALKCSPKHKRALFELHIIYIKMASLVLFLCVCIACLMFIIFRRFYCAMTFVSANPVKHHLRVTVITGHNEVEELAPDDCIILHF